MTKFPIVITILISLTLCSWCYGQSRPHYANEAKIDTSNSMDKLEYSLKTAHPRAQALMTEDFYWSVIEETGPFGSDDGWEAAQSFRQWRVMNKSVSPFVFLKELIASWQYPYFDWMEMDTTKIKAFIVSKANIDEAGIQQQIQQLKEALKHSPDSSSQIMSDALLREVIISSSQALGGRLLLGQDNAIIGTAFAQLAIEGKVDSELKLMTLTAIKRQLLPVLINRYESHYIEKRKQQLIKMMAVMNKTN